MLLFSIRIYQKGYQKAKELSIGTCIIGASLLIPASASYHLLLLLPAVMLIIDFLRKEGDFKREISILVLLSFLTCNVLPHHIPNFTNSHAINTLIHFPRLYGLTGLFVFLLVLQKRYLQANG